MQTLPKKCASHYVKRKLDCFIVGTKNICLTYNHPVWSALLRATLAALLMGRKIVKSFVITGRIGIKITDKTILKVKHDGIFCHIL